MRFIGFIREVLTWVLAAVVVVLAMVAMLALAPPAVMVDWLRRRKT